MTNTTSSHTGQPRSHPPAEVDQPDRRNAGGRKLWLLLLGVWFTVQFSNVIDRGPLIGATEYLTIPFGRWRMFTTFGQSGQHRRLAYVVQDDTGQAKRLDIATFLKYHDPRRNHIRGDQNFCLRIAKGEFDRPGALELATFIERAFEQRFGRRMHRLDVYEQAWPGGDEPEQGTTRLAMRYSDERISSGETAGISTAAWNERWSEQWE